MAFLPLGLEKWESHRETGEMRTAIIFSHLHIQKCGLDESSPYRRINPKRNRDKKWGPQEMGPGPIFMAPFLF